MPNDTQRIEIITRRERCRRYTAHEKVRFVEETMQPGMTISAVVRMHNLSPSLLFGWRRRMAAGGQVAVQADDEVVAAGRMRELEARVRDLERLLGRKTLEVEVLKEAMAVARVNKSRVAAAVAARGLFPVKVVTDVFGVALSSLVEQIRGTTRVRGPYRRADDETVLIAICALTDVRPTYGYRRVTAILNRTRRATGAPALNHKRVFRLMKRGSLLLQRHAGGRPVRAHAGRVIAPASNQRWSTDGLEIGCWNGEIVRVGFAIDTHDREVMAWAASTAGVTGQMMRDLMLTCVEARFGGLRVTHPVQWLADNGSAFTAAETLSFAAALNLVPCLTPVRSPESNGVSEAFVKTLKRDYARVQPRPTADTVLARIGAWITDYNEHHPHRGLGMRSPREFIRAQIQPAPCPV